MQSAILLRSEPDLTGQHLQLSSKILPNVPSSPMWIAPGGLNILWILSWLSVLAILPWFQLSRHSCISRFDPTKFVPLYEQITVGFCLFVINLQRHIMKEWVDKECTTPTGTPVVRRQVKTQPYFFRFQSCFSLRGSKKSTPSLENGGAACRWSAGWPAIKGGSAFSLFKHNILTKFALQKNSLRNINNFN